MNEQLRRRSVGAPAARSLLLTVLGEYVLPGPDSVWQETLVAALHSLGFSQQAARQALSRSTRDGWLKTERRGRRVRMQLSSRTAELLRTGAERIYSFGEPWGWERRWLLVVVRVPENRREVRHQLRSRLAWAGLGSLGGGVWITPHVEREAEIAAIVAEAPVAEATSFVAEFGAVGDPRELVASAWDLAKVREEYLSFVDEFSGARPTSAEACFRLQTQLVHSWRRIPFLDPDLPTELLPADWPRKRAQELFRSRHERWAASARAYFTRLQSELDLTAQAA